MSPTRELVTEGRIVYAGALADQGRLHEALALLRKRAERIKKPAEHHLRLWYALADLEERAGNLARARELFHEVRRADPAFADVAERLAALVDAQCLTPSRPAATAAPMSTPPFRRRRVVDRGHRLGRESVPSATSRRPRARRRLGAQPRRRSGATPASSPASTRSALAATDDVDALLALAPDCVVLRRAAVPSRTPPPSPDYVRHPRRPGVNVVDRRARWACSTRRLRRPRWRAQLEAAAADAAAHRSTPPASSPASPPTSSRSPC